MTEPEQLSSPAEVLAALAALLGMQFLKAAEQKTCSRLQKNCRHEWSSIAWEPCCVSDTGDNGDCKHNEDDGPEVDFSSFPSLSLVRSHGEQFDSDSALSKREDVEAHVSSLLSRPILVSNSTSLPLEGGDDNGEMLDFMASKVSEVPTLMLQNFFNSFTTLMNSRLRAYATFLARHGLSLLENAPANAEAKLDEGIVGVEHKLETMLEIGRTVSTNAIATSFQADKEGGKVVADDSETHQLSLPLVMNAAIDISLPRPSGGQHELVTVSFRANGNITGVFTKAPSGKSLLRAVQVDLDMNELLPPMIAEAASVISCIVDMTNTIYSLSLPRGMEELRDLRDAVPRSPGPGDAPLKRKERAAVVEPDVVPMNGPNMPMLNDATEDEDLLDDSSSSLSPEHLVDYILHETDDSVLSPPSRKKAKIVPQSLPAVPGVTQ